MNGDPTAAPSKHRWRRIAGAASLLLVIVLFGYIVVVGIHQKFHGPSAEEAFGRYIRDPIPESVKNLRIHYAPHMKGYWLYLVFEIAPEDLESLFDVSDFQPMYHADAGYLEHWDNEKQFRRLDPDDFMDLKAARRSRLEGHDYRCDIIASGDRQKVYFFRFSDADIARARAKQH